MEKKICMSCGKKFEYKKSARYNRKFCDKCSKKRRQEYENLHTVKFEDLEDE